MDKATHLRDAVTGVLDSRIRELMREGMSKDEAEDKAVAEVTRSIRSMPSSAFRPD